MEFFQKDDAFYIILEYCEGGTLRQYLGTKKNKRLGEWEVKKIIKELLNGYKELRDINITHRDLKLDNLLLTSSHNYTLKIADFGIAKQEKLATKLQTSVGTVYYMAPEILKQ